jgi:hypothetical protein
MAAHPNEGRTSIVLTVSAARALSPEDLATALRLTSPEEFPNGDIRREKRQELVTNCKLLSAFRNSNGLQFWIITEEGGRIKRILLPEDCRYGVAITEHGDIY